MISESLGQVLLETQKVENAGFARHFEVANIITNVVTTNSVAPWMTSMPKKQFLKQDCGVTWRHCASSNQPPGIRTVHGRDKEVLAAKANRFLGSLKPATRNRTQQKALCSFQVFFYEVRSLFLFPCLDQLFQVMWRPKKEHVSFCVIRTFPEP